MQIRLLGLQGKALRGDCDTGLGTWGPCPMDADHSCPGCLEGPALPPYLPSPWEGLQDPHRFPKSVLSENSAGGQCITHQGGGWWTDPWRWPPYPSRGPESRPRIHQLENHKAVHLFKVPVLTQEIKVTFKGKPSNKQKEDKKTYLQFSPPEMAVGISSLFCYACVYLYLDKRDQAVFPLNGI